MYVSYALRFMDQRIDAFHSYGQTTAVPFWNYGRVEL